MRVIIDTGSHCSTKGENEEGRAERPLQKKEIFQICTLLHGKAAGANRELWERWIPVGNSGLEETGNSRV